MSKKIILRNDPAKKRKIDPENPYIVADNMMEFINSQEHWKDYYSPAICHGMLLSVLKVIYHLAPTRGTANELIYKAMQEYEVTEELNDELQKS